MTTYLKAARIAARGRPLIGVTAVAFAALSLGVGVGPALLLIAVAALVTVFVWLVRHHPLITWAILGFVQGLTGSRST